MDWILSFTTLGVNWSLGWASQRRFKILAWTLCGMNSILWIAYGIMIKQYGLLVSATVNAVFSFASAWKVYRKEI